MPDDATSGEKNNNDRIVKGCAIGCAVIVLCVFVIPLAFFILHAILRGVENLI